MFQKLTKSQYILHELFSFIPFRIIKVVIQFSKKFQKKLNIKFEDYYFTEKSLLTIHQFHQPSKFINNISNKNNKKEIEKLYINHLISYSKEHDIKIIYSDQILENNLLKLIPQNLCIYFEEFPSTFPKKPKHSLKNIKYIKVNFSKVSLINDLFSIIDISNIIKLKILGKNNFKKITHFLNKQFSNRKFLLNKIHLEFKNIEYTNYFEQFLKSNTQISDITLCSFSELETHKIKEILSQKKVINKLKIICPDFISNHLLSYLNNDHFKAIKKLIFKCSSFQFAKKDLIKPPYYLTNLTKLIFFSIMIRDNISIIYLTELISQNKELEYIEISLFKDTNDYSIDNFKKLILIISNLKNIKHLGIIKNLNNEETEVINTFLINNSLEYLKIFHNYNFDFLICFKNCPNIKKFNFCLNDYENSSKKYEFKFPLYSTFEDITLQSYDLNDNILNFLRSNEKSLHNISMDNIKDCSNKNLKHLKEIINKMPILINYSFFFSKNKIEPFSYSFSKEKIIKKK